MRRRFKNTLTFPDRLEHEAMRLQRVPANISIAAE
jgi:hypothetical protein